MARHKKLPTLSLRQRVVFFGISAIVLIGVVWSQWFMTNLVSLQDSQAFYSDLPDVNVAALQPEQRTSVIREMNATKCPCNCGLTLASCRNRDRSCQRSLEVSKDMVAKILEGKR